MTLSPVGLVGIVVPARNEERRLGRCLEALAAAMASLVATEDRPPAVRLVVVVDASTDATRQIACQLPDVEVVLSDAGRVGAARRAGVARLLAIAAEAGIPASEVWVACTDADTAVPADWLSGQLQHARSGVDMVLGTVRPDPAELAAGLLAAWRLRHMIADGHPHVHGANLGVRGDSYLAAGGFPDVATGEDVLLTGAVRRIGRRVVSVGSGPVLTSGRRHGRAPGGMADYLRELGRVDLPLQA